jgi:thiol:disulfide interchange protein
MRPLTLITRFLISILGSTMLVGLMGMSSWTSQAVAQSGFDDSMVSSAPVDAKPPVSVRVESSQIQAQTGSLFVLAVVLEHEEHYHTNLNKPIVPEEMGDFYPVATTIALPDVEGLVFGAVQWPSPVAVDVDFFMTGSPIKYQVYTGQAVMYIPVQITDGAKLGDRSFEIKVGYQACDDTVCFPPTTVRVSTTIELVESAPDADELSVIFSGYNANAIVSAPTQTSTKPDETSIKQGFVGQIKSLIILALSAALGGFILNLTPCVLPVIPIKIMTLSQHAGENRMRAAMLGIWMAIGVVAFWAMLAVPVLAFQGFTDPSRIFGIWWLTTTIGVLIAVMSAGLLGLFQITLPQNVYMINPKADSAWGSFLFGMMTAVLGLPCFGFVAGALVPAAITQGTAFVIVLFTSMGVGMALPYLILSIFPQLVSKLPRTGPASELVKQIMGLLLLAAAAYFVGSGLIALVASKPYLAKLLHIWLAAIFGLLAAGWLTYKTFQISKKPANRLIFTVIAIGIASVGLFVANRFTSDAHEEHELRMAAMQEAAGEGLLLTTVWNDFNPALMQRAIDEGFVVIQDFTAEWCINCKVLEKSVLGVDPVKSLLREEDTIMIKVDLTGKNPDGEKALADLGRTGIPTLAIYGPGLSEPWVANAYTSSQVVDAINRARGESQAVGMTD